jgi:MoaA/NifB/PqqE/SkfB family radical SAM enzyme
MAADMSDTRLPGERRVPVVSERHAVPLTDEELDRAYLHPDYDMHLMPDHATVYPAGGRHHWDVPGVAEEFERMRRGYSAHPYHRYPVKTAFAQLQMVNGTGRDIYRLVDGGRTARDVYLKLLEKYDEPYGKHKGAVYNFLRGMVNRRHAFPRREPAPARRRVTGSEDYFYPPHMSIETTANCNIRCIHCYGSFEQKRFDALDAGQLLHTLERMKAEGLRQVELTGGECTTHPEFARILRFCVKNFDLVGVLSNALNMKDEFVDIITGHAHNTMVQICINGNEAYHDKFTKVKHSHRRALAAMNRLAQGGVAIRAPMNLTFDNYTQIEETLQTVRDAGALTFLANWVDTGYGRAQDLAGPRPAADRGGAAGAPGGETGCQSVIAGMTCQERNEVMKRVGGQLERLAETYPGLVKYKIDGVAKEMWEWEKACGAGRRSLYLASNGRIGLCPMSVETGIPGFGSLNADGSMVDAVSSEFARHFARIPAPNPNDCGGCPHELEHRNCLLHGIMQFMKTPHTCKWGQKHNIQKLIDTGFHTLSKKPDGTWDLPELTHVGTGCGHHRASAEPQLVQLGRLTR